MELGSDLIPGSLVGDWVRFGALWLGSGNGDDGAWSIWMSEVGVSTASRDNYRFAEQ
jgi:hypothetical protein